METENKKILSIIIPTYNAAKFLDKGLSSFIIDDNSLLNMLDIIVVNDGSTDNSVEIAQKYVNKYPDVYRILNKENGGHGSAINEVPRQFLPCGRAAPLGRIRPELLHAVFQRVDDLLLPPEAVIALRLG